MNISHGNILAVFFAAGPAEIEEGLNWYLHANQVTKRLAKDYDLANNYGTVAALIAALSPNNKWDKNVRDAEALLKCARHGGDPSGIKVSTYGKNKEKAITILNGGDPEEVLGGKKVKAFYDCIIDGDNGDCNSVCVDGHAYSIWLGQRVSTSSTPTITPKLYDKIAGDYRIATDQINKIIGTEKNPSPYRPCDIQAITWITWRKLVKGEVK